MPRTTGNGALLKDTKKKDSEIGAKQKLKHFELKEPLPNTMNLEC